MITKTPLEQTTTPRPQHEGPHQESSPELTVLGRAADLTRAGPDGQWGDGSSWPNPRRFKK